jgi:hypothetical protein
MSIREQIQTKIELMPKGNIFTLSDLSEIAKSQIVKLNVIRLEQEGVIRRVMRGVYDYPRFSAILDGFVPTNPSKVANLLAQNYGWSITPCRNQALNMLGLSTQVVAVYSYLSNGPSRKYNVRGRILTFKHSSSKDIANLSFKTGVVVQGIKAWGRDKKFDKVIDQLASIFTKEEKELMRTEAIHVTKWVYEIIKKVCELKV